jgi:TusA-related sulfurtransferase
MSEIKILDLRGLSCPQPVLQTRETLGVVKQGVVAVLVDAGAPRNNVSRMAQKEGWSVSDEELDDGSVRLTLKK